VFPSLSYGCQTWALTKQDEKKIEVHQNKMERAILGIRRRDKIRTKSIKNKLRYNINFLHAIRRLKWDWAGHVARMENDKWAKLSSMWFLKEGRRRGKQKIRWRDEIDNLLKHNLYHRVAANRREWEHLREAFAQQRAA